MKFMILFVLHDMTCLEEILDAWETAGVTGITILLSTGLGRLRDHSALRDDISLFPSLHDLEDHVEQTNRTLLTVVEGEPLVDKVIKVTQNIIGDLNLPKTGILVVLPIARVYGLNRIDE